MIYGTNIFRRHLQYGMIQLVIGKEQFERVVAIVKERNSRVADVTREVWNLRL